MFDRTSKSNTGISRTSDRSVGDRWRAVAALSAALVGAGCSDDRDTTSLTNNLVGVAAPDAGHVDAAVPDADAPVPVPPTIVVF